MTRNLVLGRERSASRNIVGADGTVRSDEVFFVSLFQSSGWPRGATSNHCTAGSRTFGRCCGPRAAGARVQKTGRHPATRGIKNNTMRYLEYDGNELLPRGRCVSFCLPPRRNVLPTKVCGGREAWPARPRRLLGVPASREADVFFGLRIQRPEAAVSRLAPRVPLAPRAGLRRLWGEQEGAAELCLGGEEDHTSAR